MRWRSRARRWPSASRSAAPVATLKHPGDGGSAVATSGSLAIVGVEGSTQRGHAYICQA